MGVHPEKPFIGNRTFDDTYGMDDAVKRELCYQGMIFVSTLTVDGTQYGGNIIARDLDHARTRAEERGFGETVDGQLEAFGDTRND